jgi:hypothetical protein
MVRRFHINEPRGIPVGYAPPYGFDLDETGHMIRNESDQKGITLIHKIYGKRISLRLIWGIGGKWISNQDRQGQIGF